MWTRDDDFDESDLSFITKLAAVGDSYSAGIGAGDRLGSIFDALDPHSGVSFFAQEYVAILLLIL